MDENLLKEHRTHIENEGYKINHPDFIKLRSWNNILLQLNASNHYLNKFREQTIESNDLEVAYLGMAMFNCFILQYAKCFTSSGPGKVQLNEGNIFTKEKGLLTHHKKIMHIRHNLVAHNGESDLIISDIGVREDSDKFIIRHFVTIEAPTNELDNFGKVLTCVTNHTILAINKHLDKIQKELGKPVLTAMSLG